MANRFSFNGRTWTISSFEGGSVGTRAPDDRSPRSRAAGLYFRSNDGQELFLPMDPRALPRQAEVDTMPRARLLELIQRARPSK